MHGQGQYLVEPNQPNSGHDNGCDKEVGEKGKNHGRSRQGPELGYECKIGLEEDAESQGQGQVGGDHGSGLFLNSGLYRLTVIRGSPAQIVITGEEVDGPVYGDPYGNHRDHGGPWIQWNPKIAHDTKHEGDGDHVGDE